MTPELEAQIGAAWRAMAWRENHRPGLPVAMSETPTRDQHKQRIRDLMDGGKEYPAYQIAAECGFSTSTGKMILGEMISAEIVEKRRAGNAFYYRLSAQYDQKRVA